MLNAKHVIIFDAKLFESIVSQEKLNLSCYWFSNTFSLYDLIWICCTTLIIFVIVFLSMSMFCSWCKNSKCLFLINEIFFLNYNFVKKQNDVYFVHVCFVDDFVMIINCLLCFIKREKIMKLCCVRDFL